MIQNIENPVATPSTKPFSLMSLWLTTQFVFICECPCMNSINQAIKLHDLIANTL